MIDLDKFLSDISPVKQFFIGIILSSLFWYLNIFIWGKHIIEKEQIQVPFILSICFGFLWYTISLGYLTANIELSKPAAERKIVFDNSVLQQNIFGSVLTLSAITGMFKMACYIILVNDKYLTIPFHIIVIAEFLAIAILALVARGRVNRSIKKANKTIKKS
ncbi:MAG: hypothetical protein JWP12_161 [Bacteroidetes bacterium]|nr:hypothetical protein [Bacteroidota bacterium]